LQNNHNKFCQSHHKPFYQFPLANDFAFKGTTTAANLVLAGVYESNHPLPQAEADFLQALSMPETVKCLGRSSMNLSVDSTRPSGRKQKNQPLSTLMRYPFLQWRRGPLVIWSRKLNAC